MSNANQSSTNVLAENLALSRELAVLKPELEHLRAQLAQQQATLAEKLALERQVSTLEVELANEKKATKRAMKKRESTDRVEDDLRKQLREAEKELAAEKAQRQRLEDQLAQEKQTHQLSLQDQDSTRELQSDLRKKLQEAQTQLRESRDEAEKLGEELSAEKRQAKKAQTKEQNKNTDVSDELRSKLEEAETKLSTSQQEIKKVRDSARESVDEANRRSDAFEKKFEKLKTKHRELQDQLKQAQSELRKAQKGHPAPVEEINMKSVGRPTFKRRKPEEISKTDFSQITIATPSADDQPRKPLKKKVIEPSMVGEKSTFSITPFLNRGKESGGDDAQEEEDDEADQSYIPLAKRDEVSPPAVLPVDEAEVDTAPSEAVSNVPEGQEQASEEPKEPKLQPKARGRPKKILGDAPSAKKNAQPLRKTALKKAAKAAPALEQVAEEGQEDESEPADKTQAVKFDVDQAQDTSTSSANTSAVPKPAEPKKKKRKVLGSTKTLFDDDEEADAEAAPKAAGRVPTTGGAKKRAPLGGVRNAFAGASFSPLKKEKRGVGASFLA